MKKLNELGISLMPWKNIAHKNEVSIVTSDGFYDLRSALCRGMNRISNARLIAAAPELYEALRKITEEQECGQDCAKCKNHGCVIKECKSALRKASGENEVRHD